MWSLKYTHEKARVFNVTLCPILGCLPCFPRFLYLSGMLSLLYFLEALMYLWNGMSMNDMLSKFHQIYQESNQDKRKNWEQRIHHAVFRAKMNLLKEYIKWVFPYINQQLCKYDHQVVRLKNYQMSTALWTCDKITITFLVE